MEIGKLVILGSINADHILNIEQFPHPGETVIGKQYKVAFGGKGANQAVAAGLSGADIAFIACVGTDDIGERIRQQLVTDRIDTQRTEAIAAVTPDYLVRYQHQVIDADALLLQLESPLETVIAATRLAKQHQTQVILNPAPARELPD